MLERLNIDNALIPAVVAAVLGQVRRFNVETVHEIRQENLPSRPSRLQTFGLKMSGGRTREMADVETIVWRTQNLEANSERDSKVATQVGYR